MKKKFTEFDAKKWFETYDKTESEAHTLIACGIWTLSSLQVLKKNIQGKTQNVIDFETGVPRKHEIKPWPDSEMRNFQKIGKDLDALCRKLNKLLPDNDE